MRYIKLPVYKQKDEILWQTLDAAATAAVSSTIVGLFLKSFVLGLLVFGFTVATVALYLMIELHLEQLHAASSHSTHSQDPLMKDTRTNVLVWGAVIGGLAIGNFWLYFVRQGVSYADIPASAPLYKEAVILAAFTVVSCLLARTLHHRWHFSRELELEGRRLVRHLKAYVLSFVYTITLVYIAVLLSPYGANISFALLVATLFVGLRELQRFDRKHHRSAIRRLQQQHLAATAK
jgi:hypothetical protein